MAELSVFGNGRRLRAGWRILVFLVLAGALWFAGQLAASLFPRAPLEWARLAFTTAAVLVAGVSVLTRLDGRPPGALGFPLDRTALPDTLRGLLLGGGLIATACLLLFASRSAVFVPDTGTLPDYGVTLARSLLYFALAAAFEELLFRGYAFQVLVDGIGAWPATLVGAAVFSWAHGSNPSIDAIAFTNIFLAGVLLSLAYLRTRSLWFATGVHLGWNWIMGSLLGFPVSGLELFDTPLYDAVGRGASWWTGGAFGPEAGLAGTLVLLVGIAWLARARLFRESPEMRELGPIVDRRLLATEP